MARTFRRNSREYTPGTYGPFSLDSFTQNDTDRIVLTLTRENWPQQDGIARISITYQTGEGCIFDVSGIPPVYPDGSSPTTFKVSCNVPKITDGVKQTVASATATMEVFQTLRTAIDVEAVSTSTLQAK